MDAVLTLLADPLVTQPLTLAHLLIAIHIGGDAQAFEWTDFRALSCLRPVTPEGKSSCI